MKKIYFYSTLIGLGLGVLYIMFAISDPVTRFLEKTLTGVNLFMTNDGIFEALLYLGILLLPLLITNFIITSMLWMRIKNFRNNHSFLTVINTNLFFLLGVVLAFIYLGLFVQIR